MTLLDKRQRVRTDQAIHVTRRLVGTQIEAQCKNREQIPFHGPIRLGVRAGNGIKMGGEVRPALHIEQSVQKIAHRHPMDDSRLQVDGRNGDLPSFGPLDNGLALGVNAELVVMRKVGVCLLRGIQQVVFQTPGKLLGSGRKVQTFAVTGKQLTALFFWK